MSDAWKDIWDNGPEPDQQKLIDYLEGRLSAEEKHEVERMLADSRFADEAMEGLSQLGDPKRIPRITADLNRDLQQRLAKKGKGRGPIPRMPDRSLVLLLTVTLLVLIVLAYVVYRMYLPR
jgi:anti-sigma factor RsiW